MHDYRNRPTPTAPPPPVSHPSRPGPTAGRPALALVALLAWGALYAAAGGRGYGVLLGAQLLAAAAVWAILRQAPFPGRLGPRRSWAHAARQGLVAGLLLAGLAVAVSPGGSLGDRQTLLQAGGWELLTGLAVIVVGAPIAEEMLFRQGIQRQLELTGPVWISVVSSSMLFAGAHPEAVRSITGATILLTAGVVLALLRRTSGLPGAVLAHSVYNLSIILAVALGV